MNILLDSHVYLWFRYDREKLPSEVLDLLTQSDTYQYLSYASIWELQSKISAGRLKLTEPLLVGIENEIHTNGLTVLAVTYDHLQTFASLAFYNDHKDPFDRMLIAQAKSENLMIVSADENIRTLDYGISVIW